MNYALSRSVAKAWAAELPVGDAFSGPAYGQKRDFVGDIISGVADAVGGVVEGAVNVVESVAESGIGQLVATAAGFYFGGPLGAALVSGGLSLASGADPLQALLKGGLSYLGGSMLGGASGGIENSLSAELAAGAPEAAAGAATDSLASQVAGTSIDPQKFLLASANPNPGTMSDVSSGLFGSGGEAALPATDSMGVFPGEVSGQWGGATGFPTPANASPWQRALQFAKDNKEIATGGLMVGGGIINSVMTGVAQNEMLDKKLAAEKELQAQKLTDAQSLEEWKRRFIQGGSYGGGKLNLAPSTDQTLRRPDGTPVYVTGTGIINNAMPMRG